MKTTVSNSDFHDAFQNIRPDNFTYAGLNALFEYFEEEEASTAIEMELDVIGICCEYTEYENIEEYNKNYGTEVEYFVSGLEEIRDLTTVIPIDDVSFIIQNF